MPTLSAGSKRGRSGPRPQFVGTLASRRRSRSIVGGSPCIWACVFSIRMTRTACRQM